MKHSVSGVTVACLIVHRRKNFTGCSKIENRGEGLIPSPQLLITVDEKPAVNASHRNIERLVASSKFFVKRYKVAQTVLFAAASASFTNTIVK